MQHRNVLLFAGAFATAGLLAACVHAAEPANLDQASTRLSEQGAYRISYTSDTTPIPVNRMHSWTLHVETRDGRPLADAAIKVDGDMPGHGHGLPTRPRVTRNLGNGDYLVEGMKFQMGGWWVMEVTVAAAEQSDTAKFNLKLQK
jgi:hypothetical protein